MSRQVFVVDLFPIAVQGAICQVHHTPVEIQEVQSQNPVCELLRLGPLLLPPCGSSLSSRLSHPGCKVLHCLDTLLQCSQDLGASWRLFVLTI